MHDLIPTKLAVVHRGRVRRRRFSAALAGSLSLLAACAYQTDAEQDPLEVGSVAQAAIAINFGTRCQADYENNWQATWNNNTACAGFNNKFDDTNSLQFYFNLVNTQWRFVEGSDGTFGGPDSVDLMLFNAHGGTDATQLWHPFWNQNVWWSTNQARLGDDGRQASVFASYACNTMATDTTARMAPVLNGGLRIANGAYGLVWNGNHGWGNNFATRMQNGEAVGGSWLNAVYNADNRNRPITWATGSNSNDCWSRIGSNLGSVMGLPRLRDGQVGYYCWVWI